MLAVPDRVETDALGEPGLLEVVRVNLAVRDALGRDPFGAVNAKPQLHFFAALVSTIVSFIWTWSRGTSVGHSDTDGRGCAGDR